MATPQRARPSVLLLLLLLLAAALQVRAQYPVPYGYADEVGLGGEEGFRAAQGPQGLGSPFFLQAPFAPPRQLDAFGPPPPPGPPQPQGPPPPPQQPQPPPPADGPPPLPPLQLPPQSPPWTQLPPWSQLAQLPPFHNWPPGAQFPPLPPQLPPGWPTSANGNPLSTIPILSPVPHGFIPLNSGPLLPQALQQFSQAQQQQPPQQASGARAADTDQVDRPRTSHLSEPAHIYKTVLPTARHYHRPLTTLLLPQPPTIVWQQPLPVPQPPPPPPPPQPLPHRGWWTYWPRYPWIFVQPFGLEA